MAEENNKDEGPNRIMVYLRIRPPRKGEIDSEAGSYFLLDVQPDNKTCLLDTKAYSFDHIFNGEVNQGDIYTRVAEPVIANVFKGYWGTVMVYGQTGTGKSFTMCNFSPSNKGIIPRAMKSIFDTVKNDTKREYTIMFSFIQIYVDKLQDLFNPEAPELKINRDKHGVSFPGIVEHTVTNEDDFRRLYEDGNQYRVITSTKMNPESSRGHAALFIQVKSVPKDDPGGEVRNGKLFLIDLAGYERFSKTGVQEGQMALEAKTINASLLALGNVVQALSDRSEHVPWRNAKLTRMLEDAIGGRAKCSIILTAGPSSEHMHETLGTLYFGSRAMAVKTNAKLAVNIDYKKLAAKLQELLTTAEGRINTLEVEATKRQLEREEAENAFQAEWARIKRVQHEQLNRLLTSGATKEQIEDLIRANEEENKLMEEQQYQQRQTLEERHEQELKEFMERQQQSMLDKTVTSATIMNKDMTELQRQLSNERQEKEKLKVKLKEAEAEARRVSIEMNELRVQMEGNAFATLSGSFTSIELRKEFEHRIEAVKAMYEENIQLRLSEIQEIHAEEMNRYKVMYEDLKETMDNKIRSQKDILVASYEEEIDRIRQNSVDVQNKLKKNHLVIKQSYQSQKETLEKENNELNLYVEMLKNQVCSLGAQPVMQTSNISKSNSTMSQGDANKRIQELLSTIKELRAELTYTLTEKDGLVKERETLYARGNERLSYAQICQLKNENEELKEAKRRLENEIFAIKAELALSRNQVEEDDNEDDKTVDVFGDSEGITAFVKRVLKAPYYLGTQPVQSSHNAILGSLTTDLDEYRLMLKYRFFFFGAANSGKSSVVKCFSGSCPIIRGTPDVCTPTVHPTSTLVTVDDIYASRNDWYKTYIKCLDLDAPQLQQSGGFFSSIGILKNSKNGVLDPAKAYIDLLDLPSSSAFWHGIPSYLLPSKNVIYCLVYDLTKPIEEVKQELEKQLTLLHAACHRVYSKDIGGEAAKIGFCLIGTKKDALKDSRDSMILIHINRIVVMLGDTFFRLRGEDNRGLVCVGNFAVSTKDWSVVSTKRDYGPKTFKELIKVLGTIASRLSSNRPSNLLPSSNDTASHLSYMLGDEMLESSAERTSHLLLAQQRMRQGVVTLVTALLRERNVRWAMQEKELRKLISEHLCLDAKTKYGIFCESYVLRELFSRGVIVVLPSAIIEPKYLSRVSNSAAPLHDGIVVLDPRTLLVNYSLFMCPSFLTHVPSSLSFLKDRDIMMFDYSALSHCKATWGQGIVTSDVALVVNTRFLPLLGNDVKMAQELYCVMGLGLPLKAEVAMISPPHFSARMSDCLSYYLSYMISCSGDGVARQYKFNACPPTLFASLQTRLIPFSHVPSTEARYLVLNWKDASFLVLEKTRIRQDACGSKTVKDAVFATNIPLRGIMKHEGYYIYIGITGRHANSNEAIAACNAVIGAIHHELVSICRRFFRGVKVQFQDVQLTGASTKRVNFAVGQKKILTRYEAEPEVIAAQQKITLDLGDSKAREIEAAIVNLPVKLREKQES